MMMTRNFALGAILAFATVDAKTLPICLKSTQSVGMLDYEGNVSLATDDEMTYYSNLRQL